jgi:hypothetical protein
VIIISFFIALYIVIGMIFGSFMRSAAYYLGSRNVNFRWLYKVSLAWPVVMPMAIFLVSYYVIKDKLIKPKR